MSHHSHNHQQSASFCVPKMTVLLAITMILAAVAHISVAAQFMSHRIPDRNQERTAQKLIQHIMELDLPIQGNRPLQAQPRRDSTHAVPTRDSRINMYRRDMSTSSADNLIDSDRASEGSSAGEECDPTSSQFNANLCNCSPTESGKVVCRRQQQQQQQQPSSVEAAAASDSFRRETQAVYTLLNKFEKLVDRIEARPAHLVRKHH